MRPENATRISRLLPITAFAAALLFRLIGLGGSSMWLDEVMETQMAAYGLGNLFEALIFDRAQPPLEPLLTWALLQMDWGELARRLLNTLFGALALALFARWVSRRFGVATAALAALFLAASPLLVRYAHELRPYALALLLSAWALDAADRWLERGGGGFPIELVVAAALAGITHYLSVVVWLPIGAAWLEARLDDPGSARFAAGGARLLAAPALSALPLAAWWVLLAAYGGPQQTLWDTNWDWGLIERRFEELLLRGYIWQPLPEHALLLFAVLTVVGLVLVTRRRGGLALLAGLLAGTLAVELILLAAHRFSHARYNQLALPFLFTAIAYGIVRFAAALARFNRYSGAIAGGLLATAVVAASANGILGYAQHGRPDWPAIARAIRASGGANPEVAVTHDWTLIELGHYLGRYSSWPGHPAGLTLVREDRNRLVAFVNREPGCALVLVTGLPRDQHLLDGFRPKRSIVRHDATSGSALYRFASAGVGRTACFPPPDFRFEPSPGYGRLLPWLYLGESGREAANDAPQNL